MTIDEAIARERRLAKEQRSHIGTWDDEYSKKCEVYAEEHEQLAEWLEELKDYRDKNKMVVRVDVENIEELSRYAESKYNKAIDDLSNTLKENYDYLPQIFSREAFCRYIDEYAEQLKAGKAE